LNSSGKSHRSLLRLRSLGVERGDRVAAYLTNGPEAVVAFLACSSLGARLERMRS